MTVVGQDGASFSYFIYSGSPVVLNLEIGPTPEGLEMNRRVLEMINGVGKKVKNKQSQSQKSWFTMHSTHTQKTCFFM